MNFSPIRNRRTFEEIADKIRDIIIEGSSSPGERLPSEKELASQFQVGRAAVREALRILESSGLVRVKKGNNGGIFVSDLSTENVSTSISNIIRLRDISLKDITEVRTELEKIVLVYAADRMVEEDLVALEDSIQRAEERLANGEPATKENVEFHLILSRATGNEVFHILMESVMKIVSQFLVKLQPTQSQSKKVLEDHRLIVKQLRKGGGRQCVELIGKHLMRIEKRLSSLGKEDVKKGNKQKNRGGGVK